MGLKYRKTIKIIRHSEGDGVGEKVTELFIIAHIVVMNEVEM